MKIERRQMIARLAALPALGLPALAMAGRAAAQAPAAAACPPEAPNLARAHTDFGWLERYAADNAAVLASNTPIKLVMMGDSITEGWRRQRPEYFPAGRIGRGISGQTTPQMLLRMMADVVALRPKAVHIMAGTNDVAGNTGPMTAQMTRDNLAAMALLAKAHGIAVILASIPPAARFPWRPQVETIAPIAAHNQWLAQYAAQQGHVFVDYHPVLATSAGAIKDGLATDGVHPTNAGYLAMESVLTPVLAKMGLE